MFCQKIESDEGKLTYLQKYGTKNSFTQIRLGTYYADKKRLSNIFKILKTNEKIKIYSRRLPLNSFLII